MGGQEVHARVIRVDQESRNVLVHTQRAAAGLGTRVLEAEGAAELL